MPNRSNSYEIVIIEDDLNDVQFMLHAFQNSKIANTIHTIHDGETALEFLFCEGRYADRKASQNPKLILLDLKLPKVNGLEILRRLKTNPDTMMIPVVMLTSSSEEKDVVESYTLGVNSYIVKPMDFQKFVDSIRTVGSYWLLVNHQP